VIYAEMNEGKFRGARLSKTILARALREVSRALRLRSRELLSIAYVGDAEMRKLNASWRGKRTTTDVLAFPHGEIVICIPQARRQARELGHTLEDEIIFLLVHGILHVFGYDHERPKDARRMFPLQTRILKRLKVDPRL
jgi:probable rRNA maturation factor